jgi:hypothetical protein
MNPESSAFLAPSELVRAISTCATPVDCSEDRELFHQAQIIYEALMKKANGSPQ